MSGFSQLDKTSTRNRLLIACFVLLLSSFAGLPPFVGFYSKLFVYKAVLYSFESTIFIFVILITSFISAFYYYEIIVSMCSVDAFKSQSTTKLVDYNSGSVNQLSVTSTLKPKTYINRDLNQVSFKRRLYAYCFVVFFFTVFGSFMPYSRHIMFLFDYNIFEWHLTSVWSMF